MAGKYKVIFEDDWLMVVDKEGGLVTTDEGRGEAESLEKMLAGKIGLKRSGIVHRLDKGTSGLLVVAKKEKALRDLKKQFKERRVEKRYLALVCGETVSEGRVEVPVGRSEYVFGKFGADWKGKRAVTEFRREKILVGKRGRKLSLLTINLLTGRTHQIRVHLSYLRWPLLGDKLYGGWEGEVIKRPFLHAAYLSFWHPESGKRVEFESVLADDLRKELAKYDEL